MEVPELATFLVTALDFVEPFLLIANNAVTLSVYTWTCLQPSKIPDVGRFDTARISIRFTWSSLASSIQAPAAVLPDGVGAPHPESEASVHAKASGTSFLMSSPCEIKHGSAHHVRSSLSCGVISLGDVSDFSHCCKMGLTSFFR